MSQKKQSPGGRRGRLPYTDATRLWRGRKGQGRSGIALVAVLAAVALLAVCGLERAGVGDPDIAGEISGIRINEIMSENGGTLFDRNMDVPDWIELTNTGDKEVNLEWYSLYLESQVKRIFVFPKITLRPGEYLLVYADGSGQTEANGELHAPFTLPVSGGDTLRLLGATGKTLDSAELVRLEPNESMSREDDGSWYVTDNATPGARNGYTPRQTEQRVSVVPGSVEITEVMADNPLYAPDEMGQYSDYVELHNTSSAAVSLSGWYLSDSRKNLKKWAFPDVTIGPDAYLLVYCDGGNENGDGRYLHANFRLSAAGEEIYLISADKVCVSSVRYENLQCGQAFSFYDGNWSTILAPTPGFANNPESAAYVYEAYRASEYMLEINEIAASPLNQKYDWVEIVNQRSDIAIDLSGYGLTDDPSKPHKWQFPRGTTIQPREYLGVFFSGLNDDRLGGYLNADFSLGMEGSYTLCLTSPQGAFISAVYVPRQYKGVSYGKREGQYGFFYCESPSPGTANSGRMYRGHAEECLYSVRGGMFADGETIEVALSAPEGSRIYYTLDCTDPDESSELYIQPFLINTTTILRTVVYRDGMMPSNSDTQSYLYGVNNAGVRVVSLVSDPDNLFSDSRGIMIKGPHATAKFPYGSLNQGANFWMDWEREAHIEMYGPDNEAMISQECGIKLHGQYSRAADIKAFKVFARSQYGSNRFEYPIFSNRDYEEYQSFLLRASGQDYNMTFMRDSVLTSMAADTSVMYQETEVCVVYLNGVYYSLMYIRERVSKFSICQFEGWEGMEDDIDIIKANSSVKQGSDSTFQDLLDYVKKADPTTQAFYDTVDAAVDIRNYIEYMAIEIFVGNGDTLNVKRYRNAKADGKWRWVLFDLDWAFFVDTNSIARWLEPGGMGTNKYTDNTFFIACMKNPVFRDQFLTYFGEQLATTFSTANVRALFDARFAVIRDLLPDYVKRINMSASSYKKQYNKLYDYIETRPARILEFFQEEFKFTNEERNHYFGAAIAAMEDGGN